MDERPLGENSLGIAKTAKVRRSGGHSGPKSAINSSKSAHEDVIAKQGPLCPPRPLDAGEDREHRALEALRESSKLSALAGQFFAGKAEADSVTGALAAHHGEPARWKEWREPTFGALAKLGDGGGS